METFIIVVYYANIIFITLTLISISCLLFSSILNLGYRIEGYLEQITIVLFIIASIAFVLYFILYFYTYYFYTDLFIKYFQSSNDRSLLMMPVGKVFVPMWI